MLKYNLSYVDKCSLNKWTPLVEESRFSRKELHAKVFEAGILLPHRITEKGNVGGVVDSEGHFVIGSWWKENDEGVYDYDEANVVEVHGLHRLTEGPGRLQRHLEPRH